MIRAQNLGLSAGLSSQLASTFPHINAPSSTQQHLIPAVLAPNDVILRSQTGSGKSFGLLLALMAKPRIVFKQGSGAAHGIASLVLVPTNELAEQYVAWARQLIPPSMASSLKNVIQSAVRGDQTRTPQEQIDDLVKAPPHILVATPRRAMEILREPGGLGILGVHSLRTLALDEADSLLDLPGRYPSAKMIWKNLQHPPPGLHFLNEVMRIRGSYSGGSLIASAGLEPSRGKTGDERRPPEHIRRTQHRSNERTRDMEWLTPPKILRRNEVPLQLVACSASANAVLRHFFGAKTGWIRVGIRADEQQSLALGRRQVQRGGASATRAVTGQWIDLTGLSGSTGVRMSEEDQRKMRDTLAERGELTMMPKELQHCCVVVDEGAVGGLPPMRNFSAKRVGKSLGMDPETTPDLKSSASSLIDESDPALPPVNLQSRKAKAIVKEVMGSTRSNLDKMVVTSFSAGAPHAVDAEMLESLAYIFATEGARRSLAFIPPQWSLRSVQTQLQELGVPVVSLDEMRRVDDGDDKGAPKMTLLQSTSGRGLDLPHLSHVFVLGTDALGDTVQYTHLAGRASRLSGLFDADANVSGEDVTDASSVHRNPARVVSLIRGLSAEDQLKNERTLEAWRTFNKEGTTAGSAAAARRAGKPLLISSGEKRISAIYHRLGIRARRVELGMRDFALDGEDGGGEDAGDEIDVAARD